MSIETTAQVIPNQATNIGASMQSGPAISRDAEQQGNSPTTALLDESDKALRALEKQISFCKNQIQSNEKTKAGLGYMTSWFTSADESLDKDTANLQKALQAKEERLQKLNERIAKVKEFLSGKNGTLSLDQQQQALSMVSEFKSAGVDLEFKAIKESTVELGDAAGKIAVQTKASSDGIIGLVPALGTVIWKSITLQYAYESLKASYKAYAYLTSEEFANSADAAWTAAKSIGGKICSAIYDKVGAADLTASMKTAMGGVGSIGLGLLTFDAGKISSGLSSLVDAKNKIVKAGGKLYDTLSNIQETVDNISDAVTNAVKTMVKSGFSGFCAAMVRTANLYYEIGAAILTLDSDRLKKSLNTFKEDFVSGMKILGNGLLAAIGFNDIKNGIASIFEGNWKAGLTMMVVGVASLVTLGAVALGKTMLRKMGELACKEGLVILQKEIGEKLGKELLADVAKNMSVESLAKLGTEAAKALAKEACEGLEKRGLDALKDPKLLKSASEKGADVVEGIFKKLNLSEKIEQRTCELLTALKGKSAAEIEALAKQYNLSPKALKSLEKVLGNANNEDRFIKAVLGDVTKPLKEYLGQHVAVPFEETLAKEMQEQGSKALRSYLTRTLGKDATEETIEAALRDYTENHVDNFVKEMAAGFREGMERKLDELVEQALRRGWERAIKGDPIRMSPSHVGSIKTETPKPKAHAPEVVHGEVVAKTKHVAETELNRDKVKLASEKAPGLDYKVVVKLSGDGKVETTYKYYPSEDRYEEVSERKILKDSTTFAKAVLDKDPTLRETAQHDMKINPEKHKDAVDADKKMAA